MGFEKIKEEPEAHTAQKKKEQRHVREKKSFASSFSNLGSRFRVELNQKLSLTRANQLITFCFPSFVAAFHL